MLIYVKLEALHNISQGHPIMSTTPRLSILTTDIWVYFPVHLKIRILIQLENLNQKEVKLEQHIDQLFKLVLIHVSIIQDQIFLRA